MGLFDHRGHPRPKRTRRRKRKRERQARRQRRGKRTAFRTFSDWFAGEKYGGQWLLTRGLAALILGPLTPVVSMLLTAERGIRVGAPANRIAGAMLGEAAVYAAALAAAVPIAASGGLLAPAVAGPLAATASGAAGWLRASSSALTEGRVTPEQGLDLLLGAASILGSELEGIEGLIETAGIDPQLYRDAMETRDVIREIERNPFATGFGAVGAADLFSGWSSDDLFGQAGGGLFGQAGGGDLFSSQF